MRNMFYLTLFVLVMVGSFQNCSGGFETLRKSDALSSLSEANPPTPPTPALGLSAVINPIPQGAPGLVSATFSSLPDDGQISFELLNGTALAGQDYQPLKSSMPIAKGATGAQLNVQSLRPSIASEMRKFSVKVTLTAGGQSESTTAEILITPAALASKYKRIAVGDFSACGLTLDDKVRCWGGHESQGFMGLGDGNYSPSLNAVEVKNLDGVKEISTGRWFACAITKADTVACWGRGFEGQLGPAAPNNARIPYEVPGLAGMHGLSSKGNVSCALNANNNVACWGRMTNSLVTGTPGYGYTYEYTGEAIPILGAVKSVRPPCVINQDDSVSCWSNGPSGSVTVSKVAGLSNVKALAPPCAIDSQGHVACWQFTLTPTATIVPDIEGAQDLAIGASHRCATLSDEHTVKCWSTVARGNSVGQLGNGTVVDSMTPVTVLGLTHVRSLSSAIQTTCANLDDDTVKCWGTNSNLQLGFNGVTGSSASIDRPSLPNAKKIVSSDDHGCAITADAHLKCWGRNDFGQLGNNSLADSPLPVDVLGLSNVKDVIVGIQTTCAITNDDLAKCWGTNRFHQLPNPDVGATGSLVPIDAGLGKVLSLGLGYQQGCAVKLDGTAICWGSGNAPDYLPTPVAGLSNQLSVTMARSTACFLSSSNAVTCRGSIAGTIPFTEKIMALSAGSVTDTAVQACAIDEKKTVRCWDQKLQPSLVAEGATSLSVGDGLLCYGNLDGTVSIGGFAPVGLMGNGTSIAWVPQNLVAPQIGFGGMKARIYDCRGIRPILVQSVTERWLTAGLIEGYGTLVNSSGLISYSSLPLTIFDPR